MFAVLDNNCAGRPHASGCRLAPLAAAVALCFAGSVSAATITVNDSTASSVAGKCTIVDAVISVNTSAVAPSSACVAGNGSGDTILIPAAVGAITFTAASPSSPDSALVLNKPVTISGDVDSSDKPLGLINRSGSAAANFRLIDTTANLTLRGIALSNGYSTTNGGAIHVAGPTGTHPTLTLTNSIVSSSHADSAGGGISNRGAIVLNGATIVGNTSGGKGGGVYIANYSDSVTARDSTISGNTASIGNGGGILAFSASLTNTTISGNTATTGSGGGVFAQNVALDFSTVSDNAASVSAAAGVAIGTAVTTPTVTATATLIYGNNGGSDLDSGNTQTLVGDHNLVGIYGHNITLPADTLTGCDPMLGTLADNGGPTQTLALPGGSCAIDAGPTFPPGTIPSDQRGNAYARRVDAATDIGAYETQKNDRIFYDGVGL